MSIIILYEKRHLSLLEAIEYHSDEFHSSRDEWSHKMLIRLLDLLNKRRGLDHPNYLKLIKTQYVRC